MTRQLIVAVFGSIDTARQAANDFEALSEKNEGFHIENGVVVEKDAAGKLAVLAAESRPFKGGVIGAIAGGLLGILAGPLGVVTGMVLKIRKWIESSDVEHLTVVFDECKVAIDHYADNVDDA